MERLNGFLKELTELTIKYKISIGGCGCCGSPYIVDFENQHEADDLYFDEEKNQYVVKVIK